MHPELFTIPGINFPVPGYGAMVLIAYLSGTWWMARRVSRVKADPDAVLSIALISLVAGTIGSRAFYVIHYWEQFADSPRRIFDLQSGGFEVYGGLIAGFAFGLLYGLIRRLPIRVFADAAAPSMMLGMGIGRIGCFLFGCCWGGTCPANLPWAVQFPYATPAFTRQWENRQVTVPAQLLLVDKSGTPVPIPTVVLKTSAADLETRMARVEQDLAKAETSGDAAKIKSATRRRDMLKLGMEPLLAHYASFQTTPAKLKDSEASHLHTLYVHPSQLYGAIGPILLALIGNAWFYRRKHHGVIMPVLFMLYAVQRFLEEVIRSDNPHDTFGLTISQGVSLGVFAVGLLTLLAIRMMPPRAVNVKPWHPPEKKSAKAEVDVSAPVG